MYSKWKGWRTKCALSARHSRTAALFMCAYNIDLASPYLPITLFSIWYFTHRVHSLTLFLHFFCSRHRPTHEFAPDATSKCNTPLYEFNINILCGINCDMYIRDRVYADCGVPDDNHVTEIMRNNNYINVYLAAPNAQRNPLIIAFSRQCINGQFRGADINWMNAAPWTDLWCIDALNWIW